MEDDISRTIHSPYFDKQRFQRQLELIKKASEAAQKKIDYETAHNEEIVRAIDVVEDFLRKKHRLCYGGQAINAHLPAKHKFYDPDYSIPDYDFFTPDQNTDIKTLVKSLREAGFNEISAREGMHEGTVKIYVDFTPVADITQIDEKLYRILSSREYRYNGISYLDANTLRMLMYLELSRPRGEVDRWPKVYERLALFNEFVELKQCKLAKSVFNNSITEEQAKYILSYIIENKYIFAGADLVSYYNHAIHHKKQEGQWLLSTKKPIVFFSPNPEKDAKKIQDDFNEILKEEKIRVKTIKAQGGDLLPSIKIITQGKKSIVFIIEESACNSYFNVSITDNTKMRIASMDTLITLYFSLGLVDTIYFDMGSMECLANQLVEISIKARQANKFSFPFISLKCAGYQTSLPSLIRAKVRRITQKKQNLKQLLNNTKDTIVQKRNKSIKQKRSSKNEPFLKRVIQDYY